MFYCAILSVAKGFHCFFYPSCRNLSNTKRKLSSVKFEKRTKVRLLKLLTKEKGWFKMKNKLLSVLLAVALLTALVPLSLSAETEDVPEFSRTGTYNGFTYGILTQADPYGSELLETAVITGYTGSSKNPEIPETVKDVFVEAIAPEAFKDHTDIVSVTLPWQIDIIGEYAFSGCTSLTSVMTSEEPIAMIGDYAFFGCTSLTEPVIGLVMGVGVLDETAWFRSKPDGLVYLEYSQGFDYDTGEDILGKILYRYKGTMPKNTEIALDENVLAIAGGAFKDCSGLSWIALPEFLTVISSEAFMGCTSLTEIYLPSMTEMILDRAFADCTSLNEITLDPYAMLLVVMPDAFENTAWYNALPAGPIYLADSVLIGFKNANAGTSFSVKPGTVSVSPYAFDGSPDLKELTIPCSVRNYTLALMSIAADLTIYGVPESMAELAAMVLGLNFVPSGRHEKPVTIYEIDPCADYGYVYTEYPCCHMPLSDVTEAFAGNASHTFEDGVCVLCGKEDNRLIGDAYGDGVVNARDSATYSRYLAGWNIIVDEETLDLNGDGKYTAADKVLLTRYLAGWEITSNIGQPLA